MRGERGPHRRLSKTERLRRLRDHVCDHLAMGWSPEQIAGRLRLDGSEHEISHKSVYLKVANGFRSVVDTGRQHGLSVLPAIRATLDLNPRPHIHIARPG